nr:hypothetical protein [Roseitranquillus sediminis]
MACTLLILGGCASVNAIGETGTSAGGNVPDAVAALAAPGQDLQSTRLGPDGCYWYLYNGPVETTSLPLRTVEGRTICTSASPAAAG